MDTIGWKVLFFILFCMIVFAAYKYYLHYKKNKYRREAIQSISEIEANKENSVSSLIVQIMFLIKQTALQTYGRNEVASLEGENWLEFLDKKVKGVNFKQYQKVINDAVYLDKYDQTNSFSKDDFIRMSKKWINEHA